MKTMGEFLIVPFLFLLGLFGVTAVSSRKSNRLAGALPMSIPSVEEWRPIVHSMLPAYGFDPTTGQPIIPEGFVMQWITMESGGNPCAVGVPGAVDKQGKVLESGLFQLMSPQDIVLAKTSVDEMRAYCGPVSFNGAITSSCTRKLTDAEKFRQIEVGLTYIAEIMKIADAELAKVGATWSKRSNDYWALIKSHHAGPSIIAPGLAMAEQHLGHAPTSWDEFSGALLASVRPDSVKGFQHLLSNATRCGAGAFPRQSGV